MSDDPKSSRTAERHISQSFKCPGNREVLIHDLPTVVDTETHEVIGFRMNASSAIARLLDEATAQGLPEITFRPDLLLPPAPPDPISLELRRALHASGLSGAEIARQLNVTPPLVSRWLSPNYHQHSIETLRRIAEVLGMEVEVKLKPKAG